MRSRGHIVTFPVLVVLLLLTITGDVNDAAAPTTEPFAELAARLRHCGEADIPDEAAEASSDAECTGVIYVASQTMPLSGIGEANIRAAARLLRIRLNVMDESELYSRQTDVDDTTASEDDRLAAVLASRGATLHYPAVIAYRRGHLLGNAILGYKTFEALATALRERLRPEAATTATQQAVTRQLVTSSTDRILQVGETTTDLPAAGRPGAYFRVVPHSNSIAYESSGTVYLMDRLSGRAQVAPGHVDFVPSPDGRLFVTPSRRRAGLQFYSAADVFGQLKSFDSGRADPMLIDDEMRDQYPSVGTLATRTVPIGFASLLFRDRARVEIRYRVLTSWFDRVVFRDYVARFSAQNRILSVRPVGEMVPACPSHAISLPILSPTGRELAGRDEAIGTTKVFRITEDGGCHEVLDLGFQTGKVAWTSDGRRIAFAIAKGAAPSGWARRIGGAPAFGVFVLDRDLSRVMHVRGSEALRSLTFPDFIDREAVVFLASDRSQVAHFFRVVCCIR